MLREDSGDASGPAPARSPLSSGRASSVTLRDAQGGSDAASMLDPANQSLAEALNVLLRLIYVGVAILGVAYLLSGFRNINEGQRGIRLIFGKVERADLEPGLVWGPPFPFGEIVTVSQGVESIELRQQFWIQEAAAADRNPNQRASLDSLSPTMSLPPDAKEAGSIITGDASLVHARWSASYRRQDAKKFAGNVLQGREEQLVRAALMRGVVRACAESDIEQLLRQGGEAGENSIASRARQVAQDTLDQADSGIAIERLSLTEITPPLFVRRDFAKAQSATANAQKALETAQTERTTILNAVAGDAASKLIDRIDAYELAVAINDGAKQRALQDEIDAILKGEPLPVAGSAGAVSPPLRVSGSVTKVIADATLYRDQVVFEARTQADRFRAKLGIFRENSRVMVTREWTSALQSLMTRSTVQTLFMPPGSDRDVLQVAINRDPFAQREIEKAVKEAQAKQAQEEQRKRQKERGITTDTGMNDVSTD
jgi:membrane protease subunit HflK